MKKTNILEWENEIRDLVTEWGEKEDTEGAYRYWLSDLNGVVDIDGHTDILSALVTTDGDLVFQVDTPDDESVYWASAGELPYRVVKSILEQIKSR